MIETQQDIFWEFLHNSYMLSECPNKTIFIKNITKFARIAPNAIQMKYWDHKSCIKQAGHSNCIADRKTLLIQTTICFNYEIPI